MSPEQSQSAPRVISSAHEQKKSMCDLVALVRKTVPKKDRQAVLESAGKGGMRGVQFWAVATQLALRFERVPNKAPPARPRRDLCSRRARQGVARERKCGPPRACFWGHQSAPKNEPALHQKIGYWAQKTVPVLGPPGGPKNGTVGAACLIKTKGVAPGGPIFGTARRSQNWDRFPVPFFNSGTVFFRPLGLRVGAVLALVLLALAGSVSPS